MLSLVRLATRAPEGLGELLGEDLIVIRRQGELALWRIGTRPGDSRAAPLPEIGCGVE